jgi:hypothetical protein
MYPRKKVGTYSFWNYAVPPRTLMDSLHLEACFNKSGRIVASGMVLESAAQTSVRNFNFGE